MSDYIQRLSDYPVFLSTVTHGPCASEYGQIRENVGLLKSGLQQLSDYQVLCSADKRNMYEMFDLRIEIMSDY